MYSGVVPLSSPRPRRSRGRGWRAWLASSLRRSPRPLWVVVTAHILALGIALLLYALPHHVIPRKRASLGVTSSRYASVQAATETPPAADSTPAPEATQAPAETATPEPTPTPRVGDFRARFPGMFTDGRVERTDTSYRSGNISISLSNEFSEIMKSRVYIADIYIADISCLRTVFALDTYGLGYIEWLPTIAERSGAVVSINGDYYGARDTGVVIRNGELYRNNKVTQDVAILYWNGEFDTLSPENFDALAEMERGAYQSWYFGPMLLDENGKSMSGFNATYGVLKHNPRSAIGYYEPGHYCFVAVDGRNDESTGASIHNMSDFMERLGCTKAYNLDGGQTSLLCFGTALYNMPSDGGRDTSDAIIIVDQVS